MDALSARLRAAGVLELNWWQILLAMYIVCCLALIVWYFRSIHRRYQTDREFYRIMHSQDWD